MTVNELNKELKRLTLVYGDMISKIAMKVNSLEDRIKRIERLYDVIQKATQNNINIKD